MAYEECKRTAEIRAVRQTGRDFAVLGYDVNDAFLYEVHLGADRSLLDDVVARLKHFVLQLRHDVRDEVGIGVGKERYGRDQRSTVIVDDLLHRPITTQTEHWHTGQSSPDEGFRQFWLSIRFFVNEF